MPRQGLVQHGEICQQKILNSAIFTNHLRKKCPALADHVRLETCVEIRVVISTNLDVLNEVQRQPTIRKLL